MVNHTIPAQIFDLFPNLEYLELEGNDLREIPIEILKLTKLSSIEISRNPIEEVPEFLKELKALIRISISSKYLKTEIHRSLYNLVTKR